MNGKAAKRIRLAAQRVLASNGAQTYRQLKREYREKPYHLRDNGFPKHSHKQRLGNEQ